MRGSGSSSFSVVSLPNSISIDKIPHVKGLTLIPNPIFLTEFLSFSFFALSVAPAPRCVFFLGLFELIWRHSGLPFRSVLIVLELPDLELVLCQIVRDVVA